MVLDANNKLLAKIIHCHYTGRIMVLGVLGCGLGKGSSHLLVVASLNRLHLRDLLSKVIKLEGAMPLGVHIAPFCCGTMRSDQNRSILHLGRRELCFVVQLEGLGGTLLQEGIVRQENTNI